jgi:hypothetical protein
LFSGGCTILRRLQAAAEIDLEDKIKECELIGGDRELEEFIGNFADSNDYGEKPNLEILLIHLKNDEDEERILHM